MLGTATALLGLPGLTAAQSARYPERAIKLLVGFPPGQAIDIVARLLAERLGAALRQPVVVDNKPGQGGSMVLAQVAKSAPDGYTLTLAATAALTVNPHLYPTVGYDTLKDFAPVALVADLPLVLVAHAAMPFDTFGELVAYAKAHPQRLRHGSSGNGTLSHLSMELLKRDTGTRMLHVPYKGSVPAMTDLAAGNLDVGLDTVAAVQPHLQSKRIKTIAVASDKRLPLAPQTPTIAESGLPGFAASAWIGLLFPRGTPAEAVDRIGAEVAKLLADPAVEQQLRTIGASVRPGNAAEFTRLLARENDNWSRIVRESGAKVD
jgi:tripartite-type tricarboxylate transporter receptor subunit TctC